MKISIVSILLLFSWNTTFAIKDYKINDTLYVWAKNGLFLRTEAKPIAEKVNKLEYGSALIILEQNLKTNAFSTEEFKGFKIKGYWVKVSVNNQIGYVFDGYLSKLPPLLKMKNSDKFEDFSEYATRFVKFVKSNTQETIDKAGDKHTLTIKKFGNEITTEVAHDVYYGETRYSFKKLSLEEAYLFAFIYFKWTKETYKILSFQANEIKCDYELIDNEGTGGQNGIKIKIQNNTTFIIDYWVGP